MWWERAKDGGVIPAYRVPTGGRHGKDEEHARDNFGHGANAGFISYIPHVFGPRESFQRLYLRSVQTGRFGFGAM